MKRIHFIHTGGTIDSSYHPPTETSIPNRQSVIPDYIRRFVQPHFAASFETLCMKDSKFITDAIRRKIMKSIEKTRAPVVIITHGTITLAKTAEFLKKNLKNSKKVVILVGAMIPLKEIAMSDGGFNLGYAVGASESLKPGVYVCMHGKTFKAGQVKKDMRRARFVGK